ncbi:hypothetical protein B0H67DRAFT_216195 [Lasiosphaeris hirsuta]|uniref:Uncharacterized protein n=1 Tax=Lasiosphaeris hirsuta TaxID=260670 RepID=A0AA40AEY4_9PEZI|nr:hypothetical protein B0H67DRAFT_216195 [Lasiosphaeris hirsuta]
MMLMGLPRTKRGEEDGGRGLEGGDFDARGIRPTEIRHKARSQQNTAAAAESSRIRSKQQKPTKQGRERLRGMGRGVTGLKGLTWDIKQPSTKDAARKQASNGGSSRNSAVVEGSEMEGGEGAERSRDGRQSAVLDGHEPRAVNLFEGKRGRLAQGSKSGADSSGNGRVRSGLRTTSGSLWWSWDEVAEVAQRLQMLRQQSSTKGGENWADWAELGGELGDALVRGVVRAGTQAELNHV